MAANLQSGIYPLTTSDGIPARSFFHQIAAFFDSHSSYTRIASQLGVSLDTISFPDKVGQNAYGVWRKQGAHTHDVLVGYLTSSAGIAYPGGQVYYGYVSNTFINVGVGISVAWHSSSAAWQGTTNNDGADLFVDSPWKSESIVLPSENSHIPWTDLVGGYSVYAPNKNNLAPIPATSADAGGFAVISSDEDSFYVGLSNSTIIFSYLCFQRYTPTTSSYDLPYFMCTSNTPNNYLVYTTAQDFGRFYYGGGGLTIRKNLPGVLYTSVSYDAQAHISFVLQTATPAVEENLRDFAPDNKSWAFSPYLLSPYVDRRYVGYPNFMVIAPGYTVYDRIGSASFLGVGNSANGGAGANTCIPWGTNYTGSYPTGSFYLKALLFSTGVNSIHTTHAVSMSNIFDPLTIISPTQSLYRGILIGNTYYGNDNPPVPSATDVAVIREFDDPTV